MAVVQVWLDLIHLAVADQLGLEGMPMREPDFVHVASVLVRMHLTFRVLHLSQAVALFALRIDTSIVSVFPSESWLSSRLRRR